MPTTLAAGDLAIIGINADNPDAFSFVLLTDIDAGTEIFFTDNGVLSDGSLRTTEGIVKYTAPTAIDAGTAIQFTGIGGDFTQEEGNFALAVNGDQVIAYQGPTTTPTFIYAAQTNSTQFQTGSDDSNQSDLPPGLTVGTTAVAVGSGSGVEDEFDNSTYIETLTSGTREELLAAISNAANWTGSNTIIPLADGPFTVTIPPTVTLSSSATDPINSVFSVTATFSEPTSDFTDSDITVANGSVSNFSGSGTTYTFDITPNATGLVSVDIADGVATDATGNGNTAAETLSRTFDATSPTVSLTSTAANLVNSPFSVTATFSESTSDFTNSDITVANGSISNFTGSGTTYTFDVIPTATGVVSVDIADGVATDAAGNGNTAASALSRTFDITAPTVISASSASGNEDSLTPISANNFLEVTGLNTANTVEIDIGLFGLETVSQLQIFITDTSGTSRTEIGSISILEGETLPNSFSPTFTASSDDIEQGSVLQFELIDNGQIRLATVTAIGDDRVALDFGEGPQLTASLTNETSTTNVLIDDASAIDLTGLDGESTTIEFSVFREATQDNTVRVYRTDFADGGITDALTGTVIQPGETGYEQAAIARQVDLDLIGQNNQVNSFTTTLNGGDYLGIFLIVDGTDPATNEVYFSHMGANSDGTDRAIALGNNTFGFEDMPNLGDRDFNDVVVEFSIA